jgi:hypothetical protein
MRRLLKAREMGLLDGASLPWRIKAHFFEQRFNKKRGVKKSPPFIGGNY